MCSARLSVDPLETRCGEVERTDSAVAEFDGWLRDLTEGQGSDLHVKVGAVALHQLLQPGVELGDGPVTVLHCATPLPGTTDGRARSRAPSRSRGS